MIKDIAKDFCPPQFDQVGRFSSYLARPSSESLRASSKFLLQRAGILWCALFLLWSHLFAGEGTPKCLGVHSVEDAERILLHRLNVPFQEANITAAYLDERLPAISWALQCPSATYRGFVKYFNGLGFDVWVRVNGKRLMLPRQAVESWQDEPWQGFMWSAALELGLGFGFDTSVNIEGPHVQEALLGGGVGQLSSVSGLGEKLLFMAVSIENVSEQQISPCMACQLLVLSAMLSNAHGLLLILDGAIMPSKRPDLWVDETGVPRDWLPPGEFDVYYLHVCADPQWLKHWSQLLGFSTRSIEDTCKRVFLRGPHEFLHLIYQQRRSKGAAQFPFAANFDSYCMTLTSLCKPWEFIPTSLYLGLCGPLWNTISCLERINRPDHWIQHNVEIPYWWYDDILDSRFRGHPFLSKELAHADYHRHVEEATQRVHHRSDSSLPVARGQFLYLCQASYVDGLPVQYAFFTSQSSELLVTTWKRRTQGALYFPNSTLAEGRQMLFAAARLQERRQGWRYMYWIMIDDDVSFLRGGPRDFEAFLAHWEPAVGVPANYWHHAGIRMYHLERADAYATYHVDHQVIAYHHEVIDELWPFNLRWDRECWWTSQWYQGVLASLKYQGHVLVSKQVVILNPVHDSYPRASYKEAFDNATLYAQSILPTKVRHCARFVDDTSFGYPWGQALQKNVRYDLWHIDGLEVDCSYNTTGQATRPDQPRWPPLETV